MTNNELDIFIELVALHKSGPDVDQLENKIRQELELVSIIKKYAYEISFVTENSQTKKVEDWLYEEDIEKVEDDPDEHSH